MTELVACEHVDHVGGPEQCCHHPQGLPHLRTFKVNLLQDAKTLPQCRVKAKQTSRCVAMKMIVLKPTVFVCVFVFVFTCSSR